MILYWVIILDGFKSRMLRVTTDEVEANIYLESFRYLHPEYKFTIMKEVTE